MTAANTQLRVCVVGSGTHFLSGISYYTIRLANALAGSHEVSAILMRRLLPTRFYPGRQRVGSKLTTLQFDRTVSAFDGVDWYWVPSLAKAIAFLIRQRPQFVVMQWWTGTVLHSYLALALAARAIGARVLVEFHEVQDTGEARLLVARSYVAALAPLLVRLASGFIVHSEYDRVRLSDRYRINAKPVAVIPHGPYDHYSAERDGVGQRQAPETCCNLLYFGVVRPFKGLEDLLLAFNTLPQEEIGNYWLTIVGETWEGWTVPNDLIASSPYRDRITFVNRYVNDEEVASFFAQADAVVLPYHRSSASGPLHIAMSHGLPVVVTSVGGLTEAVAGYEGVILVPPRDPGALQRALLALPNLRGRRFADPHSWSQTIHLYENLFAAVQSVDMARRRVSESR